LTLTDLLIYGIVAVSPMAPMWIFGLLSERGHGHVVTTVLLAMFAMLLTGTSYGRMARAYPSAGSAFTYVAREIHPSLGYVTGWGMLMDYLLTPMVCAIWIAQQSHDFLPDIPVLAWKIFYVATFTLLNVQGIRSSARINIVMAMGMGVIVVLVVASAVHYILGHPHSDPAFFTRPFYDPQTFSYGRLFGGTSLAVLTYIGFDGISTLSEEAENPRRNIMRAILLTCVVIGLLSAVEVYVAQLIWPASEPFPNVDTAFVSVARRIWNPLFIVMGLALVIGNLAGGVTAHLGGARLLYGMGRTNALPQRFFGVIDPKHHVPRNSVVFIGAVVLVGSSFLTYGVACEMLNFGALIAYMGVNAAAVVRYFVRAPTKKVSKAIPPVLGFFICAVLWWNLEPTAKVLGSIWIAMGITFGIWRTRGFRVPLSFEVSDE
jgi:amino acid transporter